MENGVKELQGKIKSFQRKYYLNIFLRGSILTAAATCMYLLVAALTESSFWLGTAFRFTLFAAFFILLFWCLFHFLKLPFQWWILRRGLSEQESAREIGRSIPGVGDRLLNVIQLSALAKTSELGYASISQKAHELEPYSFETVIDLRGNLKYLKYLLIPVAVILLIMILNHSLITQSTDRIIHFNQHYSPEAPFKFELVNKDLEGFYNEDFTLMLDVVGNARPESVYIVGRDRRVLMSRNDKGGFTYTFDHLQNSFEFQFEAAGYYSDMKKIKVYNRPELTRLDLGLEYPVYLRRKSEMLKNTGNLQVPEGTRVTWNMLVQNNDRALLVFGSKDSVKMQNIDNQLFTASKQIREPGQYELKLNNERSANKERIVYTIDVIKDEYPTIQVNNFRDSILYKRIILSGSIGDDYGNTKLELHFAIKDDHQKVVANQTAPIGILNSQLHQNFFYNWSLDSINLKSGETLEYFLEVWDNDGVNGKKSTRTAAYTFSIPTNDDLLTNINETRTDAERKIEQSVSKANKLQDQIEQAAQKLKGKQNLDWQDKKMLEDIVQQKQNLEQTIQQMKEQNDKLQQKKESFTEQDERIKEKADQIQKLMNQVLDEETKKLFEELQKLLKENADANQIQKTLDKLNQNTSNLEKELDRMLDLFKEVEYEAKLDVAIDKLKEQIKKQEELLNKTQNLDRDGKPKDSKSDDKQNQPNEGSNEDNKQLSQEQQDLKDDFAKTEEKINELKRLGDDLNKSDDELPKDQDSKEVEQEQENSQQSLDKNEQKKAKESQQKALQKMKDMASKMEGMQSSMEMEMDEQNIEDLRKVVHGLIKLSFNQEGLMKRFSELQQNDPRFNQIAEEQLKIKDDVKVLEDTLTAVAKRDPFMGPIVSREVTNLNDHLDKVTEANKERRRPQASAEMQFSMTSINNLALMIDDHLDQMMEMMAKAKPSMKSGSKKKGKTPSLSQMQEQLNNKIEQLKKSGKTGRQLSEDLAGMAAEQERIRRALQDMQDKIKSEGKTPGDVPTKLMEQTEMDLVNKQLTEQMIRRQKEILTRLLETEKSMREQDMDDERKGETAKDYEKEMPKAFQEYLRLKEKEVELLRSIPPKLIPYYKQEVDKYFKRLNNQQ